MRKLKAVLLAFYQHFFDPVTSAYDKLQDAVRIHARHKAEVGYYEHLRDHHTNQAAGINPYEDWNGFAREKNKEHEYAQDLAHEQRKALDAWARVVGREQMYEQALTRNQPACKTPPSPLSNPSSSNSAEPIPSSPERTVNWST